MKILLVTGRFPQRSETFIYRKAVALSERGHDVTVLCREQGDWSLYPARLPLSLSVETSPPDILERNPARALSALFGVFRLGTKDPSRALDLYRTCTRDERTKAHPARYVARHLPLVGREVDVVHFEFLGVGAMYPLARELVDAPLVVSCRGQDLHMLPIRDSEIAATQLATLRDVDGVHCVSAELARHVAEQSGRSRDVWVNRPAVDAASIVPKSSYEQSPRVRLIATGRLVWKKGFDYLLAALARVRRAGLQFTAEIIGEGPLRQTMIYSIADLGLQDSVVLAGALSSDAVLERMRSSDVFVLSSVEEGISNAVLEAMASGLPVVTTNAGGMAEAVSDGRDGFVVNVRDVDAMADRIGRLIVDAELRERMGRSARVTVESDFTLDRQVRTFEQMYSELSAAFRSEGTRRASR
jgi:glycosyltransferase involved in cell wall biosynthesis